MLQRWSPLGVIKPKSLYDSYSLPNLQENALSAISECVGGSKPKFIHSFSTGKPPVSAKNLRNAIFMASRIWTNKEIGDK